MTVETTSETRLRAMAKDSLERVGKQLTAFDPLCTVGEDMDPESLTDDECVAVLAAHTQTVRECSPIPMESSVSVVVDPDKLSTPAQVAWGFIQLNLSKLDTHQVLARARQLVQNPGLKTQSLSDAAHETDRPLDDVPAQEERDRYLRSPLGERDRWIYNKRRDGRTNEQIIDELREVFVDNDWELLTSTTGIANAVRRYCSRTGTPPPPNSRGGRPRRKPGKS